MKTNLVGSLIITSKCLNNSDIGTISEGLSWVGSEATVGDPFYKKKFQIFTFRSSVSNFVNRKLTLGPWVEGSVCESDCAPVASDISWKLNSNGDIVLTAWAIIVWSAKSVATLNSLS